MIFLNFYPLFYSAAHPERIFVGIHAQNEGGDLEPGKSIF